MHDFISNDGTKKSIHFRYECGLIVPALELEPLILTQSNEFLNLG